MLLFNSDIRIEIIEKYANEYMDKISQMQPMPLSYKYQILGINPYRFTPPLTTKKKFLNVIWDKLTSITKPHSVFDNTYKNK